MSAPPVAVQGILAILVTGLIGAFGYAFATRETTHAAVARIHSRRGLFRFGGLLIVAGLVFAAEAGAIAASAGIAQDSLAMLAESLVGYAQILLGVAVLDLVVWWPQRANPR